MIYGLPFIITLAITPIVRRLALSNGFVDNPEGDPLKIHKEKVAFLGGTVIVLAMVASIYGIQRIAYSLELNKIAALAIAGMVVFGVGLWDDIKKGTQPVFRLLAQTLAGVIVLSAGIRVSFIPVPWISIAFTLFYIVGAINAFNVIDGMDGLCTGISLIASIGFFFIGLKDGNMFLVILSTILFMSLLGFLPYNFHPARIFLGDAGSGFLGYMMGVMAVMATSKPFNLINFIVPILIISVPVLDTAFAILRRAIRKKPFFIGDRDHIYDLLLKKGWSQPKVWGVMCGVQAILVLTALLAYSV